MNNFNNGNNNNSNFNHPLNNQNSNDNGQNNYPNNYPPQQPLNPMNQPGYQNPNQVPQQTQIPHPNQMQQQNQVPYPNQVPQQNQIPHPNQMPQQNQMQSPYQQQNSYPQNSAPPQNFGQQNQKLDDFSAQPYNQNGYNAISQESMHDFYEYKQSRTKLIVTIVVCLIAFTFVLGVFATPFYNGNPMYVNEEARNIKSYSIDIKDKTSSLFKKDTYYYSLAGDLSLNTESSNVTLDSELSRDIAKMETLRSALVLIDKSKKIPVGFDGTNGLHYQMIAIVELRITQLNNLRLLAQNGNVQIKAFNQNFKQYINKRNAVLQEYNNKFEANFHKELFNMKELEF